jgi:penicillin-binding protein 1A
MPPYLSYALGSGETTVLKMTAAYAMLDNGGKKIIPTFVDRVQDRRGKTILMHDQRPCKGCGPLIRWEKQVVPAIPDTREQIADPRTTYQMVSMLEGVVQRGTAAAAAKLGRPLAGKTGTTNDSKDVWFMGFSPDMVVGVFVGFDEPKTLGRKETGASVALPVFMEVVEKALKDQPATPFRVPPGIRNVMINADTGEKAFPGDMKTLWESFIAGTGPNEDYQVIDGAGDSFDPAMTANGENENSGGDDAYYGSSEGEAEEKPALSGTGGLY